MTREMTRVVACKNNSVQSGWFRIKRKLSKLTSTVHLQSLTYQSETRVADTEIYSLVRLWTRTFTIQRVRFTSSMTITRCFTHRLKHLFTTDHRTVLGPNTSWKLVTWKLGICNLLLTLFCFTCVDWIDLFIVSNKENSNSFFLI